MLFFPLLAFSNEGQRSLDEDNLVVIDQLCKKECYSTASERTNNLNGMAENTIPYVFKLGGGFYNPRENESIRSYDNKLLGYGEIGIGYHFDINIETMLHGRYVNDDFNFGGTIAYFVPLSDENSLYFSGGVFYSESRESLPNFGFGFDRKLETGLSFYMESIFQSDSTDNQILFGMGLKFGNAAGFQMVDVERNVVEPRITSSNLPTQSSETLITKKVKKVTVNDAPIELLSSKENDVTSPSLDECRKTVIVKKGDWLYHIADREGISRKKIRKINSVYYNDINKLKIGDLVCIIQ